jgi:hypothetical protein
VLVAVLAVLSAARLAAPPSVGSCSHLPCIEGVVWDHLSRPAPSASVVLEGTSHRATADERGHFAIDSLPFGDYVLRVYDLGFVPSPPDTIRVTAPQRIVRHIRLVPDELVCPHCVEPPQPDLSTSDLVTSWLGCYTLSWRGSPWGDRLPDSLRLEPRNDRQLLDTAFVVRWMRRGQDTTSRWQGITRAWWIPAGDSLFLIFAAADASWHAGFRRVADSLAGQAAYWISGSRDSHFTVWGRRTNCP